LQSPEVRESDQARRGTFIRLASSTVVQTCQIIENTDIPTLDGFVRKVVADEVGLVATEEHSGYRFVPQHEVVRHSQGEYVRGEVHTHNIESFWSLLKRGIMGTYHNVSKKYLPLYLAEFQFRHNTRKNPDIFRRSWQDAEDAPLATASAG
jgi:hypothetical protein